MNTGLNSEINNFISDKNIIKRKILSKAFNMICENQIEFNYINLHFKIYIQFMYIVSICFRKYENETLSLTL